MFEVQLLRLTIDPELVILLNVEVLKSTAEEFASVEHEIDKVSNAFN